MKIFLILIWGIVFISCSNPASTQSENSTKYDNLSTVNPVIDEIIIGTIDVRDTIN